MSKHNAQVIRDCNRRLTGLRAEIEDTKTRYAGRPGQALMLRTLEADVARLTLRIHLHA